MSAILQSDEFSRAEIGFLQEMVQRKPITPPAFKISEWIEGLRHHPKSTPFPGPHRNRRTPYTVEIMDNMSPYVALIFQDIMKGVQLGLTVAGENVIAYWIGEIPAEILYVSSTEDLLEKWATKRLDPMIDSCGLRNRIVATGNNPKSKRTGDKTFSKQFFGGALDMASAQSAASLRSDSKRVLIMDEVDGAPIMLRTGEGKFTKVAEGRTSAWDGRQKIMAISSPKEYDTSEIWPRYQLGDQRQFLVQCPFCGAEQWLDHDAGEQSRHGLKPSTEGGVLIDVVYLCERCNDAIHNHHKGQMLAGGRWVPQVSNAPRERRSYQISSLYSPIGMFSWASYWREYVEAMETPDGMRSFTNLYKGMPYRETGARPVLENVIELRGIYLRGSVPDDVIYITVGLDVQRGSEHDKDKQARIELEIVGHGLGYRTWSIDYKIFKGAVDDPQGGAWAALQSWADDGGLQFSLGNGRTMMPSLILMDANDFFSTQAVFEFTSQWGATYPCRGAQALKKRKGERSDTTDEQTHANVKRFRWVKADNDIRVLMISTVHYKNLIYRRLKTTRVEGDEQPVGFMDFPMGYPEEYFKGLTAEERKTDGSFHCPSGRPNEPLDCRVYAMVAGDVFLDQQVTHLRAKAKDRGLSQADIQGINSKTVLNRIKHSLGR